MRCPRCNGYAEPYLHYEQGLDAGTYCDWYLRCLICGEHVWQARLQVIITAAELEEVTHNRGVVRIPCSVQGCDGSINSVTTRNAHGFCGRCYSLWDGWLHGRHRIPPLLQIDGRWQLNPERVRKIRGQGRKPRDKGHCTVCGHGPVILQPGRRCSRCYRERNGQTLMTVAQARGMLHKSPLRRGGKRTTI